MAILQKVSSTALRYLSEEQFSSLRSSYMRARGKLNPLLQRIYGTFDTNDLRHHLEERIGTDYEILMVHSSMNHMKPMYLGDPLSMVKMLMDLCGDKRTLVMPGFFFGDPRIGSVRETFLENPHFNVRKTPSQVGLATELFRRSRGVVQSHHPVFRVSATGPLAEELVRGHELAGTSCGLGTPFDFMAKRNTQIIGIGTGSYVMTQVHHVEDVMGDLFPVPRSSGEGLPVNIVDGDKETQVVLPKQGFQHRRDMSRVPALLGKDVLSEWRYHHVPMFAARASEVSRTLEVAAKNGRTLFKPRS